MTTAGWVEIALFLAVLTALTPLLGATWRACSAATSATSAWVERPLCRCSATARARAGLEGVREVGARLQRRSSSSLLYVILRTRAAPVQPAGALRDAVGRLVQHRRVVHHQHELAVLRGRDDAVEPLADGRPGRPELRLGRGRHRRRRRRHPRASPLASARDARQLLRRPHPHAALRPAADVGRRRRSFLVSQGVIQTLSAPRRSARSRRRADARARPGRLAGGHQGARHQRRRLLQRQLGDAVREPDVALQLRRDAADPRDPGRR